MSDYKQSGDMCKFLKEFLIQIYIALNPANPNASNTKNNFKKFILIHIECED